MTEFSRSPSPDESDPSNDIFQDSDPYKETLRQIDERFRDINALLVPDASYSRKREIPLGSNQSGDQLHLEIDTNLDYIDGILEDPIIRIRPPLTEQDRGTIPFPPYLIILSLKEEIPFALLTPEHDKSPQEIISQLLANDELPEWLTDLLMTYADLLIQDGSYNDKQFDGLVRDFSQGDFEKAWNGFHQEADSQDPVIPTTRLWSGAHWMNAVNGELIHQIAAEEAYDANGNPSPLYERVTTDNYEFAMRVDEKGKKTYSCRKEIHNEDLPELTDEQKMENPYMVIRVEDVQKPDDGQMIIKASPSEGVEPHVPTTGYTIFNPQSADRFMVPFHSEDRDEAQRHAELIYRRNLAEQNNSTEFTHERAAEVLATLDAIKATLKAYPSGNYPTLFS